MSSPSWDTIARHYGTAGSAARRRAFHAVERALYRETLDRLAVHPRSAAVIVRDGRHVVVPALRPDEIPTSWHAPDGCVLDPVTGRADPDWRIATDGRLLLITPADQLSYDELAAAYTEALNEWESVA
ncbi:hypothetical protein [Streptomyces sp. 4F14]|uniref:hypothetical protein n=1 Tax=Streptomyces sp. 4F14 TaxID=3394380 RepID=UPI003A862B18